jgi:hypothetical protein
MPGNHSGWEGLVTQSSTASDHIGVRSSRIWALVHFNLTHWIFPARMVADHIGVSKNEVLFWLTPWRRTDEHLPLSHIAEVTHTRGLIWDQIIVESSGGLNPLIISGVPKGQARYFVDHVRERLNETPVTPQQPIRR